MIDPGAGVFLDTGYLVAPKDADDENHRTAREHFDGLASMPTLTTTSYVLDEVVTFFNVRGRYAKAVEVGERQVACRVSCWDSAGFLGNPKRTRRPTPTSTFTRPRTLVR